MRVLVAIQRGYPPFVWRNLDPFEQVIAACVERDPSAREPMNVVCERLEYVYGNYHSSY